eukprot:2885261-Rhodomonas_salina.3
METERQSARDRATEAQRNSEQTQRHSPNHTPQSLTRSARPQAGVVPAAAGGGRGGEHGGAAGVGGGDRGVAAGLLRGAAQGVRGQGGGGADAVPPPHALHLQGLQGCCGRYQPRAGGGRGAAPAGPRRAERAPCSGRRQAGEGGGGADRPAQQRAVRTGAAGSGAGCERRPVADAVAAAAAHALGRDARRRARGQGRGQRQPCDSIEELAEAMLGEEGAKSTEAPRRAAALRAVEAVVRMDVPGAVGVLVERASGECDAEELLALSEWDLEVFATKAGELAGQNKGEYVPEERVDANVRISKEDKKLYGALAKELGGAKKVCVCHARLRGRVVEDAAVAERRNGRVD